MARQYYNAEQVFTPKLIPTLVVLCLVCVAVLTPAGAFSVTPPLGPQLKYIESTQASDQGIEPGEVVSVRVHIGAEHARQ